MNGRQVDIILHVYILENRLRQVQDIYIISILITLIFWPSAMEDIIVTCEQVRIDEVNI